MDKNNNLKKGNKETQFTSDNQPSKEAKIEGKKKKKLFKNIADQLVSGDSKKSLEALAVYLGVSIDELDIETAMHLKLIEKVFKDGDTRAYTAIMDRLKGKPLQEVKNKHSLDKEFDITKAFGFDKAE